MTQEPAKQINLSISQIAPLVGFDNYNNFPRILCEIWRKYNPNEFREFEMRIKTEGIRNLANASEMNDIWELDDMYGTNILSKVKDINSNTVKTSSDMLKFQNQLIDEIKQIKDLPKSEIDSISSKICSITNKNHGINNEDNIISEFCKLSEKQLQNSQGWVNIPLLDTMHENANLSENIEFERDIKWVIVGKYDGITTDNELIEAKMRQRGLFKKMRDYENIQVQLYLHALNFNQAYLVEGFTRNNNTIKITNRDIVKSKPKGKISSKTKSITKDKKNIVDETKYDLPESDTILEKEHSLEIYIHEIKYDEYYVNEIILDRLKKFIKFFKVFIQNENYKKIILSNDIKREIWNIYITDYLDITELEF
jgi:hypothetical protein